MRLREGALVAQLLCRCGLLLLLLLLQLLQPLQPAAVEHLNVPMAHALLVPVHGGPEVRLAGELHKCLARTPAVGRAEHKHDSIGFRRQRHAFKEACDVLGARAVGKAAQAHDAALLTVRLERALHCIQVGLRSLEQPGGGGGGGRADLVGVHARGSVRPVCLYACTCACTTTARLPQHACAACSCSTHSM